MSGFDILRDILRKRTGGEYNTWGFVAMFMEMIDEAEKLTPKLDPWHPAAEPPKPEDFEPTGYVLIIYRGVPELCGPMYYGNACVAHWRRITLPK